MKSYLILIFLTTLISQNILSQNVRYQRDLKIDTLYVWINISTELDSALRIQLNEQFDQNIQMFNSSGYSFKVVKDSNTQENYINMKLGPINYVTIGKSILWTGVSSILIAGHIYMISSFGWTLPVWPVLLPGTVSKMDLQFSPSMIRNKKKYSKIYINPNGAFKSLSKQKEKFKRNFDKKLIRMLKMVDKFNNH